MGSSRQSKKGYLANAPHLSVRAIKKYLPALPAMAKGHIKKTRKGVRSTTKTNATKQGAVQQITQHIEENESDKELYEDSDGQDENIANIFALEHSLINIPGHYTPIRGGNSHTSHWMGTNVSL